jgi:RimJ/RimL family protein N-acetyltransferase
MKTVVDLSAVEVTIHSRDELQRSTLARDHRFAEHLKLPLLADDGNTSYVVAWMNGLPIGHLNLRWQGSANRRVRTHMSDSPELSQLSVWPAELRSQGIGTNLIRAAHTAVSGRGFRCVGLGVELSNVRARRLYERLGYSDWGHGPYRNRWIEELDHRRTVAHDEAWIYWSLGVVSGTTIPTDAAPPARRAVIQGSADLYVALSAPLVHCCRGSSSHTPASQSSELRSP